MATVINPVDVTDAILLSSNIPEPDTANGDPAIYVAGTTYANEARVCVVATHKIYESLTAGNVGNYPPTDVLADTPKWAEVGYTNRWKAFDPYVNTTTVQSERVQYELDATRTSSVALLNLEGASVSLSLYPADMSGAIKWETISLIDDSNIVDWYDYFFTDSTYKDKILWDYPPGYGTHLFIQVNTPGGTSSAGIIKHGMTKYIGDVGQDISSGIIDFSVKEENSFGDIYLKQGAYRDVLDVMLYISNSVTDTISKFMKSLRAKPCVWILDNEDSYNDSMQALIVYGFIKDFGVVIKTKHPGSIDECSLTVEGLI